MLSSAFLVRRKASLSSRLRQGCLSSELAEAIRMRSRCDDDLYRGSIERNAIVASLRKQRMFHFIDWQTFALTIELIGVLTTMTSPPFQTC
jgi:hypothetical protein